MATIATMLKERKDQKDLRVDQFAVAMDVPTGTLTAYMHGHRKVGLKNGKKMIKYFRSVGDTEMGDALVDFLLDLS